jgi:hypothetical protein
MGTKRSLSFFGGGGEDVLLAQPLHLTTNPDDLLFEIEVVDREPEQFALTQTCRWSDDRDEPELLGVLLDDAVDRFVRPSNDLGELPGWLLDDPGLGRVALDELVGDRELKAPVQDQESTPSWRGTVRSVNQTAISDGGMLLTIRRLNIGWTCNRHLDSYWISLAGSTVRDPIHRGQISSSTLPAFGSR